MAQLVRFGRPARVLLFGRHSLGDDLLCTTVLREARQRNRPFAIMTAHPDLFAGNADPTAILPVDDYFAAILRRLGSQVVQPYYSLSAPDNPAHELFPPYHILGEMCRLAGMDGSIALRPYLRLSAAEVAGGRRFPRQLAIHSTCLSAKIPLPTKEWGADRFAQVAHLLRGEFSFVQLGSREDPPLPVDLDLRGKTSLREAAAILAASEAFIGLEGFLTHLARAVDCPAIVIHGARVPHNIVGYEANRNLYRMPPCSPCGLRSGCPYGLVCLTEIAPAEVAAAVVALLRQPPERPLTVARLTLPSLSSPTWRPRTSR